MEAAKRTKRISARIWRQEKMLEVFLLIHCFSVLMIERVVYIMNSLRDETAPKYQKRSDPEK